MRAYDVIRQRGCGGQVGGQRGRVEGWVRGREGGQEVWGGEERGESGCSVLMDGGEFFVSIDRTVFITY